MRTPLTIKTFVDRAEFNYPDRIAIIDEPDQPANPWPALTFGEIAERGRQLAAGLDKLGVGFGERVAIVSHNAARLQHMLLALPAHGRIAVPINFRLNKEEIRYIVDHCGARVLLIDPELEQDMESIECEFKYTIGDIADSELFAQGVDPIPWEPNEDETATINYTSGTTARPKGVQQTHRALWLNATTFGWDSGANTRDVYLHTLPMFHCNGWGMPFALTSVGAKQVVLRKVDGPEILRRIDKHGVTFMCGAPAVVTAVLDAAQDWNGPIPGSGTVRMVVAGAPPPTATVERMETELGWEFIQLYGLTETAPYLTMNRCRPEWDDLSPTERAQNLNRAGQPALGVDIKISESGEILARGNVILESYWDQPAETAAALEGGWFHTGDGGILDKDNYVAIADRKKDVIISGGENISSIEVEDALFSHPAVVEVAVIGVPHEKWGESPKGLVVLAEGAQATEQELIDHCRDRLAHYKCPTSIDFRSELARTATGKLQKYKLRSEYWKDMERQIN